MICNQCGFQLPEDAAFCSNCGNRLAPSPVEEAPVIPVEAPAGAVIDTVAEVVPEAPVQPEPAAPVYQAQPQYAPPQYAPPQPQYVPPQYNQPQYAQQPYQTYAPAPEKPAIPPEYRPIGPWGYFGWQLLFALPIVGFILLIVFACGAVSNINLKNFARSYFCGLLIFAIIVTVFVILGYIAAGSFYYLF